MQKKVEQEILRPGLSSFAVRLIGQIPSDLSYPRNTKMEGLLGNVTKGKQYLPWILSSS